MRLKVFHRTTYRYRSPVSESFNELRLRSATEDTHRLEFFLLQVNPPARLRHFRDNWFNYVHYFEMPEPHDMLVIEAQSVVNTTNPYADGVPTGCGLRTIKAGLDDMLAPFVSDSHYVEVSPEAWRLGIDIRNGREDVFETAEAVMQHIYREWTYAPSTTHAATHMNEVMQNRRGVCQDFAHVMIGVCRSLGIPTRYVSGYLYNGPDGDLRGAEASHAWCEIYVPGRGWYGLDPTNNTRADERHIKIATGRDYHDAAPVSGHFHGSPGATAALEVLVEVRPAD